MTLHAYIINHIHIYIYTYISIYLYIYIYIIVYAHGRLVIKDANEDQDVWGRSGSPRLLRQNSMVKSAVKRVTFSRETRRHDKSVTLPDI
jgi:hypothetical protein